MSDDKGAGIKVSPPLALPLWEEMSSSKLITHY